MVDKYENGDNVATASSDSFIDDSDDSDDESSTPGRDDPVHSEAPLTEEEIEDLIAEFLEVESKAAEAQESLEEESLAKVEAEVREELSQTLHGDELETAVADEMETFKEECTAVLDELETECAHLLEQLDGAGVELPSLYKWIESQAPNVCSTEAWSKRTQWVGSHATSDINNSIAQAEKHLQSQRPVRRQHGKLLEEGASGFLAKKISTADNSQGMKESSVVDWCSFNKIVSGALSVNATSFGSKEWASVYLASTPQQAAELGLEFPGVDEVEEIEDIDGSHSDPFVAAAVANESELKLSEEQIRNFKKVKEEDDAYSHQRLLLHLKQKRQKHRKERMTCQQVVLNDFDPLKQLNESNVGNGAACKDNPELVLSDMKNGALNDLDMEKPLINDTASVIYDSGIPDFEPAKSKHSHESDDDIDIEKEKSHTIAVDSDDESNECEDNCAISSSDCDSDSSSDDDVDVPVSFKKRPKKKIRRILDDTELGEETKQKIAIEKERQNRLKSLEMQFSAQSKVMSTASCNRASLEGASVEVSGDASTGYIVNVVREKGEEAVRIPPSISAKLKAHQIAGIRFIWENIIQSVRKVKSGDKGLGCILAHTMGLGKTFQVIAFLYTAMRSVDLGLKTALIVTPVNVLHNWRQEFIKWRPAEFKPLRVFMLEDVSRERRLTLLAKWRAKGGVFLIGYAAFRGLSLGKRVKDRHVAREICYAFQEGPDILVCDEAHIIKNTRADTTQALKLVKCQRRIALTGSPLQNNLMEYYCMVDFVREGFLGSSHEFRNRFQNPIENGQHTNSTSFDVKVMNQRSHILYEQLKGFVQRTDMNVVKKDLPPKTVFVIAVKLSPLQRKLYKRFLDVHGFTSEKVSNERMRKSGFLAGYQVLAQIWNHPGILQLTKFDRDLLRHEDDLDNFIVDDSSSDDNIDYSSAHGDKLRNKNEFLPDLSSDWWNDLLQKNNFKEADYSGKMVLLLEILTMCRDVGDKTLVFSQSIPTLDLIEIYLSSLTRQSRQRKCWKKGKDWYRLDGRTAASERQKLVEMFNEPSNKRVKCALISTRAGSLGINLYAANRVIIVDGSWNPTYDLQAIYRAWRYGQKKPVFAYRLLAHGTMEEKIYKRQVTKEGLAARVVDKQQVYRTMSKEEMLHLFDFGDDENAETLASTSQESGAAVNRTIADQKESLLRHDGCCTSDKLMESLVFRHHPRWIVNYHEHETLLQENEEEKLSKEEQDMAWEVFRKTLEWEEVQRVPLDNSASISEQKSVVHDLMPPSAPPPSGSRLTESRRSLRNFQPPRKCTNLSHMLTLRSQGTKIGCSTVCGECAREISWEDLNRDGKSGS